jgi:hypothetical protein
MPPHQRFELQFRQQLGHVNSNPAALDALASLLSTAITLDQQADAEDDLRRYLDSVKARGEGAVELVWHSGELTELLLRVVLTHLQTPLTGLLAAAWKDGSPWVIKDAA